MESVARVSAEVNSDEYGNDLGADGPAGLVPDREQAERFLSWLDPGATKFTFQAFDDTKRKSPRLAQVLHGTLDELWPTLVELNERGAGIFVTVNETDFKGRKNENITRIRAVYQDDDKSRGWNDDVLPPPSAVVSTSPTKYQRWLLADGLSPEDYAAAMGEMIADHGNDPNCKDLARVLRVPGFFHQKGKPHLVRIESGDGRRYTRDQIRAALPGMVRAEQQSQQQQPKRNDSEWPSDEFEIERISSAVEFLHEKTGMLDERQSWLELGMALHHESSGNERDQRKTWRSFRDDKNKPLTLGRIFKRAKELGWIPPIPPQIDPDAPEVEARIHWWPDHGKDKEGKPKPHVPIAKSRANIKHALKHMGVSLYKNTFTNRYRVVGLTGLSAAGSPSDDGSIEMSDAVERRLWFRMQALGFHPSFDYLRMALQDIAEEQARNPLQEYLKDVRAKYTAKFGNKPPEKRPNLIERFFIKYGGVADTPLHRAFTRKWSLAAVRRAFKPGSKFDPMLIFESPEGWNKSAVLEALATTEWFDENLKLAMGPKEVQMQMEGKWIGEIAELVANSNKEVEAIKQFLSRTHDRADRKYDKWATDMPRHFVMAGTTNDASYLRSKTGNRRIWPMTLTKRINVEAVKAIRDLFWGEVAFYEALGESLVLPKELWDAAAEAQAAREQDDPVFEKLSDAVELLPRVMDVIVPVDELWLVLGYQSGHANRASEAIRKRIGQAMQRFGFTKDRRRVNGERQYVYVRPASISDSPIYEMAFRWKEADLDKLLERGKWVGIGDKATPIDPAAPGNLFLGGKGRRPLH